MDIMVSAFNGGLTISAQVAMLLRECHAVEQHVHFGLHDVFITMPCIANGLNAFSEFRCPLGPQRLRGEKERNELLEGEEENVEKLSLRVVGNAVNEKNECGVVHDVFYFWAMERQISRRLLGSVDVLRRRLVPLHKGLKGAKVISSVQFLFHKVHQIIPETEEYVERERDNAIIQKGKKGGGQYTFKAPTGSLRPLRRGLPRRRREVEGVQQRDVAS